MCSEYFVQSVLESKSMKNRFSSISPLGLLLLTSVSVAQYSFTTIDYPAAVSTQITGMNNNGDVTGWYTDTGGSSHCFILSNGIFSSFDVAGSCLAPFGINDSRQVSGTYTDAAGLYHGFIFSNGALTTLTYPPQSPTAGTNAFYINDAGEVAGYTVNSPLVNFIYQGGNFLPLVLANLPPTLVTTLVSGINNSGQVAGVTYTVSADQFLFVYGYQSGQWFLCPGPPSTTYQLSDSVSLNDLGDVVSTIQNQQGTVSHGYLCAGGGELQIDVPGAAQTLLYGVNNSGTLAGTFIDSSGISHGFVTTSAKSASVSPATFGETGSTTNPTASFAEPVNTATGNYYSTVTDLAVKGRGLEFVFNRAYNSADAYSGPLGVGWTHSYNTRLSASSGTGVVTVKRADGSAVSFASNGSGGFTPSTVGLHDSLALNHNGTYTLTHKNQSSLIFSPSGQLVSVADRSGNMQLLNYDSKGNLARITDTVGRLFLFAYDGSNRIHSLSDPSGRTVTYTYNHNGNLASVTNAAGGVVTYTYDSKNRLIGAVDPRGVTYVQNVYDAAGRVVRQKNGDGTPTAFAYSSPVAGTTTITDGNQNSIQHVDDDALRLVKTIDGVGATRSFTYDTNNNQTSIVDANGNATALKYDRNGNILSITNAKAGSSVYEYNGSNDLTAVTDPLGNTTTIQYDANGVPSGVRNAAGYLNRLSHDSHGQPLTFTDPLGNVTKFVWDNYGNLVMLVNGAGRPRQFEYDSLGRFTSLVDGLGHTFKVQYDALDRIISRIDALGNVTQYAFDGDGNRVGLTDANGNKTTYQYSTLGDLVGTMDALGQSSSYIYDANRNLLGELNARGKTTTYSYDAANRVTSSMDPLGRSRQVQYDPVGNLLSYTDGNGNVTNVAYDTLNRRAKVTFWDDSSVQYTYDADGNRLSVEDAHGTTKYSYDGLGGVVGIKRFDGKVITYSYDIAGRQIGLIYPDGRVLNRRFDGANQLINVAVGGQPIATYAYDQSGHLSSVKLPDGTSRTYRYDQADRLIGISYCRDDESSSISSIDYELDNIGNRVARMSKFHREDYSYDALSRLISWSRDSQRVQYTYDPVGNRTAAVSSSENTSYLYDDADELMSAGEVSFQYDRNGSVIAKNDGHLKTVFSWDPANRLYSLTNNTMNVQYDYDADGVRTQRTENADTVQYVSGNGRTPQILEVTTAGSTVDILRGLNLIGAVGSGAEAFVESDGQGSVLQITNDGKRLAQRSYDPWGQPIHSEHDTDGGPYDAGASVTEHEMEGAHGKVTSAIRALHSYGFAGQVWDKVSRVYYLRARYYDPKLGRFLSRDPKFPDVRNVWAHNAYSYALNNPTTFWDPTGRAAEARVMVDATSGRQGLGGFGPSAPGTYFGGTVSAGPITYGGSYVPGTGTPYFGAGGNISALPIGVSLFYNVVIYPPGAPASELANGASLCQSYIFVQTCQSPSGAISAGVGLDTSLVSVAATESFDPLSSLYEVLGPLLDPSSFTDPFSDGAPGLVPPDMQYNDSSNSDDNGNDTVDWAGPDSFDSGSS
jgi:RHS repeat-associated protein